MLTEYHSQLLHKYQDVRRRLFMPPNAKFDSGISLGRPRGVTGPEFQRLRKERMLRAEEARQAEQIARLEELEDKIEKKVAVALREPIQDWLIVNPERVTKTPPNFYERIKKMVAKEFECTVADINSVHRLRRLVIPRHAAMYLASKLTRLSLPQIGRATGGRDHTTALHSIREMPNKLMKDWFACLTVYELEIELSTEIELWRKQGEVAPK